MADEIPVYDSNMYVENEVIVQTQYGFRLIDRRMLLDVCRGLPVKDPAGKKGRWDRLILESRAVAIARPDDVDYEIDPSDPECWSDLAEDLEAQ